MRKYLAILAFLFLANPALAFNASSLHSAHTATQTQLFNHHKTTVDDEIAQYIRADTTTYEVTAADVLQTIKSKAKANHLKEIVLTDADACAYVTDNSRLRCTVVDLALLQSMVRLPPNYLRTMEVFGTLTFEKIR